VQPPRRSFGRLCNDDEINRHNNPKYNDARYVVPAYDKFAECPDHFTCGGGSRVSEKQDSSCCGNAQRETKEGNDEQERWKDAEIKRSQDVERHQKNKDGKGDTEAKE